ncbi:cysteine-rich protein 2-binding protein-like [Oscarella lobularis]|uniref:cysteine-rich protein 2-binding protein-like n=1 Tax=Oscarella lobularis TaxID=121494 RepID=UPI00331383E4
MDSWKCVRCNDAIDAGTISTKSDYWPSPLLGDFFFDFTCPQCNNGRTNVQRSLLSWIQVTHLALYNLTMTSDGTGGYFHWREDICKFVDDNWERLFAGRAKPSRWTNLIKSTLSTNIPALFLSGAKELGTSGWWKLAACRPLRPFLTLPAPSTSTEGENRKRMRASKNEDPHPKRCNPTGDVITKMVVPFCPRLADGSVRALRPHQEQVLLQRVSLLLETSALNPSQKILAERLKTKLKLRQRKRELGLPLFDLDKEVSQALNRVSRYSVDLHSSTVYCQKKQGNGTRLPAKQDKSYSCILSRFSELAAGSNHSFPVTFVHRLIGAGDLAACEEFISPYTGRRHKPFILHDYESKPLRLRLLEEIVTYKNKDKSVTPFKFPIDYCYVRPWHIPAVNSLCREFFWPGIDLSECLQYPDFSVVVQYRKLVIGCAFMTPDVQYDEAYISFVVVHPDWRGAGIGTFMIYHLIQTCRGKDVTLHVSAANPAMIMYQKLGFKAEEFVIDFYERYFPASSRECRHAFFLRLRR